MAETRVEKPAGTDLRRVLGTLALAQFVCSFAGSSLNVMITDISKDLDTTVQGIQTAITLFLLVMAALMIPGGKLTDRYGRVRLLNLGLLVYGTGALIASVAPNLGVLMVGYSLLQGVGTAMLIPPVYILTTLLFTDTTSRAKAFGTISAAAGVGAAAGPLLGGLIASAVTWRAVFVIQAVIIAGIVWSSRKMADPLPADPTRTFDLGGAVLSAVGLVLVVGGILVADDNGWLTLLLIAAGAVMLGLFFLLVRHEERVGKEPLLSSSLFKERTSNLGLITQNAQWLMLMGTSFTVAAYLQVVRGYNAIETGVIFTAATIGLLVSSLGAERFAKRHLQRSLILAGFGVTILGIGVLLALVYASKSAWAQAPGLFLLGFGVGAMLTPSINVVQSSFGEQRQGEISGLSRSVSNLGSSMGTAICGTLLVAGLSRGGYAAAMVAVAVVGLIGFGAALFLPRRPTAL